MRLRDEFGLEGYGLYWIILEAIAEQVSPGHPLPEMELSVKSWRKFSEIPPKKFEKVVSFLSILGLFLVEKSENSIKIKCPNLLKYKDEYSSRGDKKSGQSPDSVPTKEGETEAETEAEAEEDSGGGVATPPPCPYQEIIELYHEALPMMRRVKVWNKSRAGYLQARWREDRERQSLEWWRCYFSEVSKSDFLTGKIPPKNGGNSFIADLEWLILPTNMAKVIEGKYNDNPKQKGKIVGGYEFESR
jgi:hypothetical protein